MTDRIWTLCLTIAAGMTLALALLLPGCGGAIDIDEAPIEETEQPQEADDRYCVEYWEGNWHHVEECGPWCFEVPGAWLCFDDEQACWDHREIVVGPVLGKCETWPQP